MNLIYMLSLTNADTVRATFPPIANLSNVRHTHGVIRLSLELFHRIRTVKSLANFFESRASSLNEEEVHGHKLNDQPAFEEEVELPAAGVDAKRDGVLRQE